MATMERFVPLWMPPENTITAVAAGQQWDAVAVPQQVGLAALSVLDAETGHRTGPVIWDAGRFPRLYFLIPTGSGLDFTDTVGRLLERGCHIAVPGPTTLEPPGPCWIVPPDALVDALKLTRALQHVVTAAGTSGYTAAQLDGEACIHCGTGEPPLHPAGTISVPDGDLVRDYNVAVCTEHLAMDR